MILKKRMFITVVLLIGLLAACGKQQLEKPDDYNFEVQNFTYKNQDGKSGSLEDLKGEVWIADFIFTSCNTVCPPMTNNMARLQKAIKEEGLKDVQIVSFSVDPKVDTPEKLKAFSQKFNADFSNWHFLTGYPQEEIESLARDSFKTTVLKTEQSDQVTHGTSFYLVDQSGTVVTKYDGTKRSDEKDKEVIKDIKALQQ
ncbi:SCO family protein [Pseudalkalibacillus decolorationis]|uniref:SCO family protein n=1 Tax=Pseudalkalibacillus decolorationis TaxID=163879 RepID=UPI0021495A38|nr:SCO family protein [Pseudalkalibacillus decolorationis]